MRSVYENKRIPLQIRRLIIFSDICVKAKKQPNKIVYLSQVTELAFGVMYLKKSRKYIAYGGVFEYPHTFVEIVKKGIHKLPDDEVVMCGIIVKKEAFTKPVYTPIELLWHWNNYIKNRLYTYFSNEIKHFFPMNNELELDYLNQKFHDRLVATKYLPLWNDRKTLITPAYFDGKDKLRSEGYPERRLI